MSLDRAPCVAIMKQRHTEIGYVIIIRLIFEQLSLDAPQFSERIIGELQAPIGAEHNNRLMQTVERFALGFNHGIIFSAQIQFAGDVFEQDQKTAHRVALTRDLKGPIVRQMPLVFFDPANVKIVRELLRTPFGVLRLGWQLAPLAQTIKQLPMAWHIQQEAFIHVPHLSKSPVVESELAF